jgi:hypothetical protein
MTFRYLGTEDTAAGSTTRSPQSRQHIWMPKWHDMAE